MIVFPSAAAADHFSSCQTATKRKKKPFISINWMQFIAIQLCVTLCAAAAGYILLIVHFKINMANQHTIFADVSVHICTIQHIANFPIAVHITHTNTHTHMYYLRMCKCVWIVKSCTIRWTYSRHYCTAHVQQYARDDLCNTIISS